MSITIPATSGVCGAQRPLQQVDCERGFGR